MDMAARAAMGVEYPNTQVLYILYVRVEKAKTRAHMGVFLVVWMGR